MIYERNWTYIPVFEKRCYSTASRLSICNKEYDSVLWYGAADSFKPYLFFLCSHLDKLIFKSSGVPLFGTSRVFNHTSPGGHREPPPSPPNHHRNLTSVSFPSSVRPFWGLLRSHRPAPESLPSHLHSCVSRDAALCVARFCHKFYP